MACKCTKIEILQLRICELQHSSSSTLRSKKRLEPSFFLLIFMFEIKGNQSEKAKSLKALYNGWPVPGRVASRTWRRWRSSRSTRGSGSCGSRTDTGAATGPGSAGTAAAAKSRPAASWDRWPGPGCHRTSSEPTGQRQTMARQCRRFFLSLSSVPRVQHLTLFCNGQTRSRAVSHSNSFKFFRSVLLYAKGSDQGLGTIKKRSASLKIARNIPPWRVNRWEIFHYLS